MSNFKDSITVIGKTNFHNKARLFGIKLDDRRRHMHIIGKTGMGKSSLMLNMVVADILNGHGIALIDPHGDLAEYVLDCIPPERMKDVIYFNPQDLDNPIGFNVLGDVPKNQRHIVGDGLVGVFKKIWADSWGPRLEYILRNAILTLLESDESTLLDLMRILVDKDFRAKIVYKIEDPIIKAFWLNEFEGYGEKMQAEAIAPIQNKVGQFTSSPLIRNIIGQKKSSFNIREVMDQRKILIMNLSKGAVGEGGAQLLGAMMVTKMQMAAMSRVDIPQEERKDFFAYIDEFQNFSTDSFAEILSEARKYRLALILAHQYIDQLPETVQSAVFGNVGTTIMFRIGAGDAERFEKEVAPVLTVEDLVSLPKWKIYLKLMIDGVTSAPFSADTLPDPKVQEISLKEQIIEFSSRTYGVPIAKLKEESEVNSVQNEPQRNNNSNNNFKQNNKPNYQNSRPNYNQNRPNYQKPLSQTNYNNPKPNFENKELVKDREEFKVNQPNLNNLPKKEINNDILKDSDNQNLTQKAVLVVDAQNINSKEITKPDNISDDLILDTQKINSNVNINLNKKEDIKEHNAVSLKIDTEELDNAPKLNVLEKPTDNLNVYVEKTDLNQDIYSGIKEDNTNIIDKNISLQNNNNIVEKESVNYQEASQEIKEEIQNPILARKLKEIFSKSQNSFGGIEYNVKANVLKKEYDKNTEEKLSDDSLVNELLDEFNQRFLEKKVLDESNEINQPKLVKFKK